MKTQCPHCRKILNVKDEFAGKRGRCPGCKKAFELADMEASAPTCPSCGATVAREHVICINCGVNMRPGKYASGARPKPRVAAGASLAAGVAGLLGLVRKAIVPAVVAALLYGGYRLAARGIDAWNRNTVFSQLDTLQSRPDAMLPDLYLKENCPHVLRALFSKTEGYVRGAELVLENENAYMNALEAMKMHCSLAEQARVLQLGTRFRLLDKPEILTAVIERYIEILAKASPATWKLTFPVAEACLRRDPKLAPKVCGPLWAAYAQADREGRQAALRLAAWAPDDASARKLIGRVRAADAEEFRQIVEALSSVPAKDLVVRGRAYGDFLSCLFARKSAAENASLLKLAMAWGPVDPVGAALAAKAEGMDEENRRAASEAILARPRDACVYGSRFCEARDPAARETGYRILVAMCLSSPEEAFAPGVARKAFVAGGAAARIHLLRILDKTDDGYCREWAGDTLAAMAEQRPDQTKLGAKRLAALRAMEQVTATALRKALGPAKADAKVRWGYVSARGLTAAARGMRELHMGGYGVIDLPKQSLPALARKKICTLRNLVETFARIGRLSLRLRGARAAMDVALWGVPRGLVAHAFAKALARDDFRALMVCARVLPRLRPKQWPGKYWVKDDVLMEALQGTTALGGRLTDSVVTRKKRLENRRRQIAAGYLPVLAERRDLGDILDCCGPARACGKLYESLTGAKIYPLMKLVTNRFATMKARIARANRIWLSVYVMEAFGLRLSDGRSLMDACAKRPQAAGGFTAKEAGAAMAAGDVARMGAMLKTMAQVVRESLVAGLGGGRGAPELRWLSAASWRRRSLEGPGRVTIVNPNPFATRWDLIRGGARRELLVPARSSLEQALAHGPYTLAHVPYAQLNATTVSVSIRRPGRYSRHARPRRRSQRRTPSSSTTYRTSVPKQPRYKTYRFTLGNRPHRITIQQAR